MRAKLPPLRKPRSGQAMIDQYAGATPIEDDG
jgi:hypothetical protein